jgi:hypothetical protein
MAKRRQTIPIAHADDVPTIAFTDEQWQAIERAYGQQLNADVRQQITTVTTQYLRDCAFDRTVAPKAMARERIERIRRAAGDLEKVMRGPEGGGASGGGPEGGAGVGGAGGYGAEAAGGPGGAVGGGSAAEGPGVGADFGGPPAGPAGPAGAPAGPEGPGAFGGFAAVAGPAGPDIAGPDLGAPPAGAAPESPFSASPDELSREQRQSGHSYADGLIRRYLDEQSLARDKLHHFRDALKSLIVACDCALGDLSATENCDDEPWNWWIQGLTRIAQEHHLPYGARLVETETSREPSPFVALVRALQEHVPARHMFSDEALAKAIQRAQSRARDK